MIRYGKTLGTHLPKQLKFQASVQIRSFTFTKDTGRLTTDQRKFYELNGYLVIPRVVSFDILNNCNNRFDDYVGEKISKGNITIMKDVVDRKSVNKIQDIIHDDVFRGYFEDENLLDIVESFTGPEIIAIHTMLVAKPPDVGTGSSVHPPHQDLYYFPIEPANSVVAAWTAIEKCTKENGCLHVVPGSHHNSDILPHDYPEDTVNKMYYTIEDLSNSMKWVDVEMEPGDTVFFHPLLIHGSYKNLSNRTRRAISGHYASASCEFVDINGDVRKKVKSEVLEILKRRFGNQKIDFTDYFRMKSVLVRQRLPAKENLQLRAYKVLKV